MYLGKKSITRLSMVLTGYSLARSELGLEPTEEEGEFEKFQNWIQEKFNITSNHGWDSIILFYSVDERAAFENFFRLLKEFRNGENPSSPPPQLPQKITGTHK